VSRISPIPDRFRLSVRDPRLTATIRAGFLFGFMSLSFAIAYGLLAPAASASLGGIADRFCTSTLLQDFAYMGMGDFSVIAAWTLGSVITLVFWLGIGGLFFKGGRGFCSFFCPLGAASGLMHRAGAKLGLLRVEFQPSKCASCKKCQVRCPMNAVAEDRHVERSLCISCQECTKACHKKAYAYIAGRPDAAEKPETNKMPERAAEIEE
jgi:ferredoxin-type protein NapH